MNTKRLFAAMELDAPGQRQGRILLGISSTVVAADILGLDNTKIELLGYSLENVAPTKFWGLIFFVLLFYSLTFGISLVRNFFKHKFNESQEAIDQHLGVYDGNRKINTFRNIDYTAEQEQQDSIELEKMRKGYQRFDNHRKKANEWQLLFEILPPVAFAIVAFMLVILQLIRT